MLTHTANSESGKLSYRDFVRFPNDGKRHELIDGVHYVTPSPATAHQRVLGNLYFLIRLHLEEHGGGEVFVAPFDVVLSLFDIVEPDVLFVSDARKRMLTEKHVKGSPDLVLEIRSATTGRRDEGVKLQLYDRSDVAEYWVVDPETAAVRVYRRAQGRLVLAAALTRRDSATLASPLLAGCALPLARIFANVR
jgi:Uma2 family endonuclease